MHKGCEMTRFDVIPLQTEGNQVFKVLIVDLQEREAWSLTSPEAAPERIAVEALSRNPGKLVDELVSRELGNLVRADVGTDDRKRFRSQRKALEYADVMLATTPGKVVRDDLEEQVFKTYSRAILALRLVQRLNADTTNIRLGALQSHVKEIENSLAVVRGELENFVTRPLKPRTASPSKPQSESGSEVVGSVRSSRSKTRPEKTERISTSSKKAPAKKAPAKKVPAKDVRSTLLAEVAYSCNSLFQIPVDKVEPTCWFWSDLGLLEWQVRKIAQDCGNRLGVSISFKEAESLHLVTHLIDLLIEKKAKLRPRRGNSPAI